MIISANDKKNYRHITLDNGLKALLIQDPLCKQSAASLAVNVGHFNDPVEQEGLAHLLEHMMFLGTEKYPDPNEYQQFIRRHGGSHNAWTGAEYTNYYFSIDNQYFDRALDRFSNFFVAPTLDGQWIEKEINAVDSEFLLKLNDDSRRLAAVTKATVNPKHPYSKFSVGNHDTLNGEPHELELTLKTFYETHYSSDKMSLVLFSNQPLDVIEQYVVSLFSPIIQRTSLTLFPDVPLYKPKQQHVEIHAVPDKDIKKLSLSFQIPMDAINYYCKPLSYIAYLLGHEGEGSLLSRLKILDLANGLSAGTGLAGYNFREFIIHIELTELGLTSIDRIIALTFQNLQLINEHGVDAWRYTEKYSIMNAAFDFQEISKPAEFVSHLSINMFKYDQQDIIYGDYAMESFEPDAIHRCLKAMSPEKVRIVIVSQDCKLNSDTSEPDATDTKYQTAKWYNTPYYVQPISKDRINHWKSFEKDNEIKLPAPNPFVVERLAFTPPVQSQSTPTILFDQAGMRLWHFPQSEFTVPKGHIYTAIDSPAVNTKIKSQVLCRLYVELLHDSLAEVTFPAEIAGMHYDIYPHSSGVTMHISGYTPKLFLFFEILIAKIRERDFNPSRFNEIKHQLEKNWHSQRKAKPINKLFKGLSATLQPHQFDYPELLQQLNAITLNDVKKFTDRLYKKTHLESFVQGDWPIREVNIFATSLYQQISAEGKPHPSIPRQVHSLANQKTLVRTFENSHDQSAAIMYFQGQDSSPQSIALWTLTCQVFSPLFFAQIRTKLQLGYVSGASYMPINRYPGMMLYIQSSVAGANVLIEAMNNLLNDLPSMINDLSPEKWQDICLGMITKIDIQDTSARQQALRHWKSICNRDIDFTHQEKIISAINKVTLDDLIEFVNKTFLPLMTDRLIMITDASNEAISLTSDYQKIKDIKKFKSGTDLLLLTPD